MDLKVCCLSLDISTANKEDAHRYIEENLDHDIFLLPEYYTEVIDTKLMSYENKLVIYSSKHRDNRNSGKVIGEGLDLTFSKIKLTPWEKELKAGNEICYFEFKGVKCAVIICFDIEFPEIAIELKLNQVEVLFVPSATEGELGYQRINRCASSRSVELCCAVITCNLIGESDHEMVDKNTGGNNCYFPSQSLFKDYTNEISIPQKSGDSISSFVIPIDKLRAQRAITDETNPFHY